MAVDPHVKPRLVDRPRSGTPMPPSHGFRAGRSGEVVVSGQPRGNLFGSPGPDLGYALTLGERFRDRLDLAPQEKAEDALAAGCGVAMRRCSRLGRAPTSKDVELGLTVLGYLGGAPADYVAWRRRHVQGAGHDYAELRELVDAVAEDVLLLDPGEAKPRLAAWRDLYAGAFVAE